jgi:amphi-Trp domain-containing protein
MSERDVEKNVSKDFFIETLRRVADALEKGESFRIQVAGERVTIPAGCELLIEHERDDEEQEIELQFRWKSKE